MNIPAHILLTNDDGPPDPRLSPCIHAFVEVIAAESKHTSIDVVTPANQQSWVSKAISKRPISPISVIRDSHQGRIRWSTVDGTPASTTNIAISRLEDTDRHIDLVLSGPNYGQNAGRSYALSSGTVGAAIEAAIRGYKAIALSFGYNQYALVSDEEASRCSNIAWKVIKTLYANWGEGVELYNVNLMLDTKEDAPIYETTLLHGSYGALYRFDEDKDQYVRGQLIFDKDAPIGTDRWALNNGYISVTPMKATFMTLSHSHTSPFPLASPE